MKNFKTSDLQPNDILVTDNGFIYQVLNSKQFQKFSEYKDPNPTVYEFIYNLDDYLNFRPFYNKYCADSYDFDVCRVYRPKVPFEELTPANYPLYSTLVADRIRGD